MAKKKLLEDIKAQPGRFYRQVSDVARDRRFDDNDRLEILNAWAEVANETDVARAGQIKDAIADVRQRLAANDHAAE
jgi:hypothetical protein